MENSDTKRILDVVCMAAAVVLESGGETHRAEETVIHMCEGLDISKADIVALPTGMTITITKGDELPLTRTVRVEKRSTDLKRLNACNRISRKTVDGSLKIDEIERKLKEAKETDSQNKTVLLFAGAASAIAFTVMFGGGVAEITVAVVCGLLVQLVQIALIKQSIPGIVLNLLISTVVTLIALISRELSPGILLESIISGAIMPLIPGVAAVNGIRDILSGDLVSGGARVFEAVLNCATLAVGIGLMLAMWDGVVI